MHKKSLAAWVAILGMVLVVGACQKGEAEATWQVIEPGLSYVDSTVGDGPVVKLGDYVTVHYTGWIWENETKGNQFDSSVERGDPITFPVGRSMVIEGWEKGLPGIAVGGKRTLLIEHTMAYGERGHPPVIPPSATLIFDIEIIDIPSVEIEVLEPGSGPVAELGDQVSVHYTGFLWENGAKGKEFDSSRRVNRPYTFTLGAGMVIPGWDSAIEGMKVGQKANLIIPSAMAYGKSGSGATIPPDATLLFEVEIMDIESK